ncbi:DMT family transporter [Flagellimonas taeanensis]|jgi:drug/metabolite transporter (DMT)-like permease|uniref:Permease of the drug/metabolite transporter (DMT) superfamily n=1 Tax=Flagellimonas taeanensis TaxID=1005926 RepID=A0A1M6PV16_9FLAO|nr:MULTISPECIES: DMT family transporter [Allomuricauda]MDC6385233.1 DMT family transporter [Muricauda sp. SK9]MEE1961410.1 DMT family transporter [Allomuricauda taeanensis]RIV52689.1 DMT family transporter [Allomuricauda taeanensis]SFB67983.1 Permease of the drug/metabolite transporter (DMT) superfamily [Allomuricauda taeanensis]SHK11732.1 Permease of the drug/metabolite transporter (DMT) superfamily [Allomuricauda taeanensis]
MSKRTLAILAAIGATTIYGINHTVAKGVMPTYVKPFGFIMLRVTGAALLFWIISLFGPKEKIEKRDWLRVLACSILGMVINMLSFFKGLQLSTPINSAVLVTITPIFVVILSALFLSERITLNKGLGVFLGFAGALGLILFGAEIRQDAPNIPLGNFLFVVNATSYGAYLIVVKTLIEKYHPFTLMKWLFTIAVIINLPITLPEVLEIEWSTMPLWAYGSVVFVVIGTTFLTYLFNVFALTELKASTISAFMYMQPLVGIIYALLSGKDHLTLVKIVATAFVLVGVYLASKRQKAGPSNR